MQVASRLREELRQFFVLRGQLRTAIKQADPEETRLCIEEIQILAMHTSSEKLRKSCNDVAAGCFYPPVPAFHVYRARKNADEATKQALLK